MPGGQNDTPSYHDKHSKSNSSYHSRDRDRKRDDRQEQELQEKEGNTVKPRDKERGCSHDRDRDRSALRKDNGGRRTHTGRYNRDGNHSGDDRRQDEELQQQVGNAEQARDRGRGQSAARDRDRHASRKDNGDKEPPEKRPKQELPKQTPKDSTRPRELDKPSRQTYGGAQPVNMADMYSKLKKKVELEEKQAAKNMPRGEKRFVVIDGENVAWAYGRQRRDWEGVAVAVNYFKNYGHEVTAVLPHWAPAQVQDMPGLRRLRDHIAYSPHRRVGDTTVLCSDDLFALEIAKRTSGVVVSNDSFRKQYEEHPQLKDVIANRVLTYRFVKGQLILPLDPLGDKGPSLEQFLQKQGRLTLQS